MRGLPFFVTLYGFLEWIVVMYGTYEWKWSFTHVQYACWLFPKWILLFWSNAQVARHTSDPAFYSDKLNSLIFTLTNTGTIWSSYAMQWGSDAPYEEYAMYMIWNLFGYVIYDTVCVLRSTTIPLFEKIALFIHHIAVGAIAFCEIWSLSMFLQHTSIYLEISSILYHIDTIMKQQRIKHMVWFYMYRVVYVLLRTFSMSWYVYRIHQPVFDWNNPYNIVIGISLYVLSLFNIAMMGMMLNGLFSSCCKTKNKKYS